MRFRGQLYHMRSLLARRKEMCDVILQKKACVRPFLQILCKFQKPFFVGFFVKDSMLIKCIACVQ